MACSSHDHHRSAIKSEHTDSKLDADSTRAAMYFESAADANDYKSTADITNYLDADRTTGVCAASSASAEQLLEVMIKEEDKVLITLTEEDIEAKELEEKRRKYEMLKEFQCGVCGKYFHRSADLKRHSLMHTGVKPFPCPICNKGFTQKPHLQTHVLLHEAQRPYPCPHCEKGYTQKHRLDSHIKIVHEKDRPFACSMCDKSFARNDTYKLHMKRHDGYRPYACDFCARTFTQFYHYKNHMDTHNKVNRNTCHACQRTFSDKGSLNRHNRRVHNGQMMEAGPSIGGDDVSDGMDVSGDETILNQDAMPSSREVSDVDANNDENLHDKVTISNSSIHTGHNDVTRIETTTDCSIKKFNENIVKANVGRTNGKAKGVRTTMESHSGDVKMKRKVQKLQKGLAENVETNGVQNKKKSKTTKKKKMMENGVPKENDELDGMLNDNDKSMIVNDEHMFEADDATDGSNDIDCVEDDDDRLNSVPELVEPKRKRKQTGVPNNGSSNVMRTNGDVYFKETERELCYQDGERASYGSTAACKFETNFVDQRNALAYNVSDGPGGYSEREVCDDDDDEDEANYSSFEPRSSTLSDYLNEILATCRTNR